MYINTPIVLTCILEINIHTHLPKVYMYNDMFSTCLLQ